MSAEHMNDTERSRETSPLQSQILVTGNILLEADFRS
jgi:hypothetical protein